MSRKALYNSCPEPECRETVLWMPYEDRCGKCGFGGKPKGVYLNTAKIAQKKDNWNIVLAISSFLIVFIAGIATGVAVAHHGVF